MYVKRLQVIDFRNYENQTAELSQSINVFEGRNAQGKTNLLEALYLLCVGRSMRSPRDKELIRWDTARASVRARVEGSHGYNDLEVVIDRSVGKCVSLNGLPLTRLGELMGVVLGVMFSPEEIKTIKESPSERRRFMDIALSQLSKNYFYLLGRYNKVLAQRNKLLKSRNADEDALDVWDLQLAETGAGIVKSRRGFLKKLQPHADSVHSYLTDGGEQFTVAYEGAAGETTEDVKESLTKALLRWRETDLRMGFTHCGPHKDDISVKANGIDVRSYGSQGQQRTAALTLKLSLLRLMTEFTKETPILLLDDVMSELDSSRRARLLELIKPYQTIITCTELPELNAAAGVKRFTVESGRIIKES